MMMMVMIEGGREGILRANRYYDQRKAFIQSLALFVSHLRLLFYWSMADDRFPKYPNLPPSVYFMSVLSAYMGRRYGIRCTERHPTRTYTKPLGSPTEERGQTGSEHTHHNCRHSNRSPPKVQSSKMEDSNERIRERCRPYTSYQSALAKSVPVTYR